MTSNPSPTPKRGSHGAVVSFIGALALMLAPSGVAKASTPMEDQNAMLGHVALAIAAYKASAEQCYYDPKDSKIFDDIDAFFTRRLPEVWPRLRDSAPDSLPMLQNTARLTGSKWDCATIGNFVGLGLFAALYTGQLDATVGAEMDRLAKGGGRGKADPAPAGPPAPLQRTAAETVAAMNAAKAESDAKAERDRAARAAEPAYPGYAARGFATPQPRAMVGPNLSAPIGGQPTSPTTPLSGHLASASPSSTPQRPADSTRDTTVSGPANPAQEPTEPAFSPARAAVSDCLKDVDLTHDEDLQFSACYESGLTKQDARLNREYNEEKRNKIKLGRIAELTAAQRAWIGFRDSWCAYQAGSDQVPSSHVTRLSCLFDLTLDQADRLTNPSRLD